MTPSSSSDCGCHGTPTAGRRTAATTIRSAPADRMRTASPPALRAAAAAGAALSPSAAVGAASGTATPMELLGSSAGITVIDPATVLTRLWYFDGRFLRAEGFRLDQEYVRSLVALSNRAAGTGVVHGLDVDLVGDRLRVEGGVGLAPSGRVVHLASTTDLGIGELIARSTGSLPATSFGAPGDPSFGPCPPDNQDGDAGQPVTQRSFYVLTAASAEALCGEEERFGQLCGDACAADADRSVAVEGVRFRARLVTLALPTSRTVPFTSIHLRSQVASAYYRLDRLDVPSMISAAGLRSTLWCDGAEGIGGEEIALAIFDRAGTVTTFADMWTARRELVETTPQHYWQRRLSMRPLAGFLAEVLQFQCQLADLPAGSTTPSPTGPCAEERDALVDVHAALGVLEGGGRDVAARLDELRQRVSKVLDGAVRPRSGSMLIDHGVVETPPAGYLPVDPGADVRAQATAWFGPGVDLRFCAVRPDFVPEAFQEAQHMDRISLTRGIDDPRALEEVDVLVPGATFERAPASTAGYEGTVDLLPSGVALAGAGAAERAALRLSAVARQHDEGRWSWTLAAFGEAPQRLAVGDLVTRLDATLSEGVVDEASFATVHQEGTDALDALRTRSTLGPRLLREATSARARAFRLAEAGFVGARFDEADEAVEAGERRPAALWFDADAQTSLDDLPVDGTTSLSLRLVFYSRASTTPAFLDVGFAGTATVRDRQVQTTGVGGAATVTVETRVDGAVTVFSLAPAPTTQTVPLQGATLVWRIQTSPTGRRLDGVQLVVGQRTVLEARFSADGSPRQLEGRLDAMSSGRAAVAAGQSRVGLAAWALAAKDGVFDLGSPGRDLAGSVVDIISAELAARRGDTAFEAVARRRILPDAGTATESMRASADWVMFHRRRTRDCGDAVAPVVTRVIRYRWLHGLAESPEAVIKRLGAAASATGETAMERLLRQLDISAVTAVEFAEGSTELASSVPALRAAWTSADRGDRLVGALSARWGAGEGSGIEGGRLASGVRALEGLVDSTGVVSLVLDRAPGSLQSEGFDGVFLTVGAARERAQAQIAIVHLPLWRRVRAAFAGREAEYPELMKMLRSRATFLAEFAGADLTNGDKVADWWSATAPRSDFELALLLDRSIEPLGEAGRLWTDAREPAVRDVVGGPAGLDVVTDIQVTLEGASALLIAAFTEVG